MSRTYWRIIRQVEDQIGSAIFDSFGSEVYILWAFWKSPSAIKTSFLMNQTIKEMSSANYWRRSEVLLTWSERESSDLIYLIEKLKTEKTNWWTSSNIYFPSDCPELRLTKMFPKMYITLIVALIHENLEAVYFVTEMRSLVVFMFRVSRYCFIK